MKPQNIHDVVSKIFMKPSHAVIKERFSPTKAQARCSGSCNGKCVGRHIDLNENREFSAVALHEN